MVSHLDTVFPPEEEARNNFHWSVEGDRIFGPGTHDIKGGTVMMWLVLRALQAQAPEVFEEHHLEVVFEFFGRDVLAGLWTGVLCPVCAEHASGAGLRGGGPAGRGTVAGSGAQRARDVAREQFPAAVHMRVANIRTGPMPWCNSASFCRASPPSQIIPVN
jgi:hypothetical protein